MLRNSFNYFHTHASIVIRTDPEASLVTLFWYARFRGAAEPSSVFIVYQMLTRIVPAADGPVKIFFIACEFKCVKETDNGL